MLDRTLITSCMWHGAHVMSTTRRSPGLTKRMKSSDSCRTAAADRWGFADVFQMSSVGATCARFFASLNAPLFGSAAGGAIAVASPPWQSVQPIAFAVVCIDVLSGLWHVRHPALLRATSASLCWRGTCGARGGGAAPAISAVPATGNHPSATSTRTDRQLEAIVLLMWHPVIWNVEFGIWNACSLPACQRDTNSKFQIPNSE